MAKFEKEIYVTPCDGWYTSEELLYDECGDGIPVAKYQLVSFGKIVNTARFEEDKKAKKG